MNASPLPSLKTKRLLLRPLQPDDATALSLLRSDGAVNQYILRPKSLSVADAQTWIEKTVLAIEQNEMFYWAISLQKDAVLIGTCCVFRFSDDKQTAELGYELYPAFHGQGIITEAITAVIAFAFANTTLHGLKALTHKHNKASIQTLLKQGFQFESESQDAALPDFLIYRLSNPHRL